MKKFISVLIASVLLLSLAACGDAGVSVDATDDVTTEAPASSIGENDIMVSPDGDDSGDGTEAAPLATITAAKELAKKAPEGAEVTVWLRGGRYQLSEPIIFDENDRAGVTYSAYKDEKPVLSFGTPITGWKESEINGVPAWTAEVPENMDISMLSSDTKILDMSRYPSEGYFRVKQYDQNDVDNAESASGQKTKSFIANTGDLMDFSDAEHVIVRASSPYSPWCETASPLEDIDPETGLVILQYRSDRSVPPGAAYYFMNVREAVKNPGEWYYDRYEHLVYYIPCEEDKMDSLVLYAAGSADIMSMDSVDGITFRGITFRDSDREDDLTSYGQTCISKPNAINIDHTDGIVFDGCEFRCIGRSAVCYNADNRNGAVTNCVFSNIGAVALFVKGTNVKNDDPTVTKNFTVTNNLVEYYSRFCHAADGVCLCFVDTAELSNNEIHDGYYTGISVGWVWEHGENPTQNISIKDNLVYNIGYGITADMGGIYTLGEQAGTVISGNVVYNVNNSQPTDCYMGNGAYQGIYLDQGSSFITVEKNLVYKCYSDGITVTGTCDSVVVRNNITAYCGAAFGTGQKFMEYDHSLEVCNNIFTSNRKTNLRIFSSTFVYNDHDNIYFDYYGKTEDEYKLPDFTVNPMLVDPLFADPENFDFTLSEDSPALAAGFEVWDYSKAGRK